MINNYILISLRSLAKNRLYSLINIVGLSVGLCVFGLILMFVSKELSYDSFIDNSERIFRLEGAMLFPGRAPMDFVPISYPVIETLKQNFPSEIEDITHLYRVDTTIQMDEAEVAETISYVDPNFLKFFNFDLKIGERDNALKDTTSIVISQAMATKYFGDGPVVGEVLSFIGGPEFRVTGILSDLPETTHLSLDFMALYNHNRFPNNSRLPTWTSWSFYSYVKMFDPSDLAVVEQDIDRLVDENITIQMTGYQGTDASEIYSYSFTALEDIHFYSSSGGAMKPRGDPVAVYTFTAVAALIIFIANVNFVNLSTARSMLRAREVGLRKTLGAKRTQLISQFLTESVVMALISLFIAIGLMELLLPWFNQLMDIGLTSSRLFSAEMLSTLFAITLGVGVLGGFYPAFYLSSFKPIDNLQSGHASGASQSWFRSSLVVLQFSISIILLIATAVVFSQTLFARNMNMGFEKDSILILDGIGRGQNQSIQDTLSNEIRALPEVVSSGFSSASPHEQGGMHTIISLPGDTSREPMIINGFSIDDDFLETYKIDILHGRGFSQEFTQDALISGPQGGDPWEIEASVLINESAIKLLGFDSAEQALGKQMDMALGPNTVHFRVVGIVPDIYYETIHQEVDPSIYFKSSRFMRDLNIRFSSNDLPNLVKKIEALAATIVPDYIVSPTFLDERIEATYTSENKRGRMFGVFAMMAILIACLGLYGLASFNAERKAREIGIRKVMGAENSQILRLFIWQFSKPVLVANLLAWPSAWFLMNSWLSNFAYRIEISPIIFVGASAVALVIAWLTVGGHALRVVKNNPINALRHD